MTDNSKNAPQNELELRIDEILYYVWDPIGIVNSSPAARTEYSTYVNDIYESILSGKSVSDIATILGDIVTSRMEIESNPSQNLAVAQLIWEWSRYIKQAE